MCHCVRIICSKEYSTKARDVKTEFTGTVVSLFFDELAVSAAPLRRPQSTNIAGTDNHKPNPTPQDGKGSVSKDTNM